MSDDEVRARLTRIVRREEALRITDASLLDGGWAGYADRIDLPLSFRSCGSQAEMLSLAGRQQDDWLDRDGTPLWRMTVFDHPDDRGGRARTLHAAFDHFVTDGRSMHLIEQELTAPAGAPGRTAARRSYRDWVARQHAHYPWDDPRPTSPAREFWHRHLAGTSVDRPTALPFARVPPPGTPARITSVNLPVPLSAAALRAGAARLGVSPFLLVLTAVAGVTAQEAGTDDITLRVISNGRPAGHLNTLGWLADSFPVRLSHPELPDAQRSLTPTTAVWAQLLEFHTTPIGWIRATCPPAAENEIPRERRRMQLVVNFVAHDIGGKYEVATEESTEPGDIDGLHIVVLPGPDGRLRLGAMFSPGFFPPRETRAFLDGLVKGIARLALHGNR
ncbi:hypothetical protein [Streptomyces sp. N50]|uniref:hypothetical protein n=1 Tax=Streptomyces sp. N50 TaxID=3081765 RepID=UPI00296203BA|nr:hypothetical protein [Streptomyces sp. N50]WOX15321.1 hypothetical protein R2B38_43615 [Streptomyces sp. N50]